MFYFLLLYILCAVYVFLILSLLLLLNCTDAVIITVWVLDCVFLDPAGLCGAAGDRPAAAALGPSYR